MMVNDGFSRKQERFLQGLLLGKSIVESAKFAEISEPTATRWMRDPLIQAEKKRREDELAAQEQAEIQRILTTGYAAIHNRVKDLDRMAHLIEQSWHNTQEPEKIVWQWMTPDKLREWRGMLDDIAKELGQRVKKQEIEHSWADTLDSEYDSLLSDLGGLPDAHKEQTADKTTETNSA
jgi:hypothetical protein